jgi:hypothetical protein
MGEGPPAAWLEVPPHAFDSVRKHNADTDATKV